jgi:hypothetical protein
MPDEPVIIEGETGPPIGEVEGHTHETPIVVTDNDESPDEIEDDIDELAEALAVHSIISEERHDEILERVDECRMQLESLSTTGTAESPLLTQIMSQLVEIRAELMNLKSSMDSRPNRPQEQPSESPTEEPVSEEGVLPEAETTPPKPQRRNRFV